MSLSSITPEESGEIRHVRGGVQKVNKVDKLGVFLSRQKLPSRTVTLADSQSKPDYRGVSSKLDKVTLW